MNVPMSVSVVVPTYNRGAKLAETLQRLLASERGNIAQIDIVVVDDGSQIPAARVVEAQTVPPGFQLRCIRQQNAGPAKARNNGFRQTSGDLVLFMDDDILVPPSLIQKHVTSHERFPGAVIFGRSPFREWPKEASLAKFLDSLGYSNSVGSEKFADVEIVASGHISVPRDLFTEEHGVYRDDLATPAAEEFELSARLMRRHVRMIVANEIVADHDHSPTLVELCKQAFKYGVGAAEYTAKCDCSLDAVRQIIHVNGPVSAADSERLAITKLAKMFLAISPVRKSLLLSLQVLSGISILDKLTVYGYRLLLGTHYFAGVRFGLAKYSKE